MLRVVSAYMQLCPWWSGRNLSSPSVVSSSLLIGRFLGGVRRCDFFFEREAPGLRKCGFHQNYTPASAISTRYRVGLGGVAFVPPGAICALLSGAGAV